MRSLYILLALVQLAVADDAATTDTEATSNWKHVKPLSGTIGGNMFPGVVRPFGVVKLGVDVNSGQDAYSGYQDHGKVNGFSMLHESGTGGAPKYGVVSQMPVLGKVVNPVADLGTPRQSPDEASVGSYTTKLNNGIQVDLGASEHAGMLRYTFPISQTPNIVVDVSHLLPSFRGQGLSQKYLDGNFEVFKDGHYEGNGVYSNGWNMAPAWTIYYCGYFDKRPTSVRVFEGDGHGKRLAKFGGIRKSAGRARQGAVFSWNTRPFTGPKSTIFEVESRVGVSFISSAKACQFVNTEIPKGKTYDVLVSQTRDIWEKQVLSKVTTSDTNAKHLEMLYTSLYGMFLMPSNRTGENPLWKSTEPYYDDFFTFWDLWHSASPLMHILQPKAHEEVIRSIIDTQRHEGFMPDARSSNFNGRTQGGSNADNVLADAFVKGMRGKINWSDGLAAMIKDGTVTPRNNKDPMAPDSSTREGRGALPDWLKKGYISTGFSRSVSRAVDYSVNDYAIYQVAKGLGKRAVADEYLKRSRQWRNHWNPKASSLGFSGFLMPRDKSGKFVQQNPLDCRGCYWKDAYYEGTPWEYTFGSIHDVHAQVALSGGPSVFLRKLLTIFKSGTNPRGSPRFGHTIFDPSNEPDFMTPYLFNYVGRQDVSVQVARYIGEKFYTTGPASLPGNSDAGAMQSWLLWNMIGLYPVATTTTFLISSPWLSNMVIHLDGGKTLTINSVQSAPDQADNHFVQSLKVNGKHWDKSWLDWADIFKNGGSLDFTLGTKRANWATGPLPPQAASEKPLYSGRRVTAPKGGVFTPIKDHLFI